MVVEFTALPLNWNVSPKKMDYLDQAVISVLAEDTIAFDTPFRGRFGLSLLLELEAGESEEHILFDTNSEAQPILHNLRILDKSLDKVETIFLSHCHYDHTDGLNGILDAIDHPVSIVAHSEIFRPCFELNPDGKRHIGMSHQSPDNLEGKGAVLKLVSHPLTLMSGVMTTGEIERVTTFEELEDLYTTVEGETVQDHERDDSAIVLNFQEGLVIITGCCHAGIVNTMIHAKKITGVENIHAVIGGLHLIDASNEKIEKSVQALEEVDWVFAGHCTGFEGLHRISEAKGDRFAQFHTGSMIHFPIEDPSQPIKTIPTAERDHHRF
jgi:7,8-dihydropterin-6-yl-methyl-4-(beta-D-ribofuranosyl)aminobenzene 5'-phosphate synthase